eukprot:Skav211675  [mRNA]  locus=scaffold216:214558:217121:+ [translate_table: standard]
MGKGGKGKGKTTKVWTKPKTWEPRGKSNGKGKGGGQWIWESGPFEERILEQEGGAAELLALGMSLVLAGVAW